MDPSFRPPLLGRRKFSTVNRPPPSTLHRCGEILQNLPAAWDPHSPRPSHRQDEEHPLRCSESSLLAPPAGHPRDAAGAAKLNPTPGNRIQVQTTERPGEGASRQSRGNRVPAAPGAARGATRGSLLGQFPRTARKEQLLRSPIYPWPQTRSPGPRNG